MTPGVEPFTQRTPRVSAARRLQRRRDRDETGRFLAEGPQAVREALARPGTVIELFITAEAMERHKDIVAAASGVAPIPTAPIPGSRISGTPIPGAPIAGASIPGAPIPGAPTPGTPIPGTPIPGTPIPGAPIPGAPISGTPISAAFTSSPSDKPEISLITEDGLNSLAETVTPQGMVAVCHHLDVTLSHALTARPRLVVVLAGIRDPGNAGTVLRTADAAGAGAVVFAGDTVDPYNGKCVRASAGSLFHVDLVRAADPHQVITTLRDAGLTVLAADGYGSHDLDTLADDGALATPTAWVFGSEAHGLPADLADETDARVRVPLHGRAESLNLAAAAAVCLYASARAHRRMGR